MNTDSIIQIIIMRGYRICTILAIIGCLAFISMLLSSTGVIARVSMWVGVYSLLGMGYILLGIFIMITGLVMVSMIPW